MNNILKDFRKEVKKVLGLGKEDSCFVGNRIGGSCGGYYKFFGVEIFKSVEGKCMRERVGYGVVDNKNCFFGYGGKEVFMEVLGIDENKLEEFKRIFNKYKELYFNN